MTAPNGNGTRSIRTPAHVVWSSKAAVRTGPPDFKLVTPRRRLPQNAYVTIMSLSGNYAELKDASGASLGWTKRDNLRLPSHAAHEAAVAMLPSTATVGAALDARANTAFARSPVIDSHLAENNVALRWNRIPAKDEPLDVLIHVHGFHKKNGIFTLEKVIARSGVSFDPLKGTSPPPPRSRVLLAIAPRGKKNGVTGDPPNEMDVYNVPALLPGKYQGLEALVEWGLGWFSDTQVNANARPVKRSKRLILTAHSGGGRRLDVIIAKGKHDPAEIHLFDAIYQNLEAVRDVTLAHIDADAAMLAKEPRNRWEACMMIYGHALRALFNPASSHEGNSCWLARQIENKLATISNATTRDVLRRYYRVERVPDAIDHYAIAPTYGPWLLADAGASLEPAVQHVGIAYCDAVDEKIRRRREEKGKRENDPATLSTKSLASRTEVKLPSIW